MPVGLKRSGPSGVSSACDSTMRAACSGDSEADEEEVEEVDEEDDEFHGRGGSFPVLMARSKA